VFVRVRLRITFRGALCGDRKNRGERYASQGVELGRKRSAALDDGATGGMSAIILRTHSIAAAKVRRQSRYQYVRVARKARSETFTSS
jgi:hypothetical protein